MEGEKVLVNNPRLTPNQSVAERTGRAAVAVVPGSSPSSKGLGLKAGGVTLSVYG